MTFKEYLIEKFYSKNAIRMYCSSVDHFLLENRNAPESSYTDIVNYLAVIRKYNPNKKTQQLKLLAIKKYFDFLIETGQRETHPCKSFHLKGCGKKGVLFSGLFSSEELELLLNRKEKFVFLRDKNLVMASLLIYQGLLPKELVSMKVQHIDLEGGTVYIKGGEVLKSRRLELYPKQFLLFDRYMNESRKRLLKQNTDLLLLNFRGKPISVEDVQFLVESQKGLFPDRNLTATAIRDSVIANLLNERKFPLEQVQLFAGHRWISSTQRYQQADLQEQLQVLERVHPLG